MKIRTIRSDGLGDCDFGERTLSPEEGTWRILKYELGFGGGVESIEGRVVTIKTAVFGKVDTVVVTLETEEEGAIFFTMLKCWYEAGDGILEDKGLFDDLFKATNGNAFLVTNAMPLFLGEEKVRRTLLLCLGLADKPQIIERLQGLDSEDIVVVSTWLREGYSWEEALEGVA